ncbi:PepSY domain-containing protein [Roseicella frigidaeris]|uniref:PepSY domain-containing protein n=1 Tax=Roseicella frigidaeris TaxID=2230885 RepID=A0A327LXI6_9PROT|nr:PepSY domain-containing protein [Roseicella frigidaeris]RAI55389.1 PepSY domain-containing protein [Roseicella frigidaeris]
MPRTILAAALLAGAIALAGPARADQPGADWISRERVAEILKQAGYGPILSMEADDGHWEGKTTRDGKPIEFHVDPHTGKITKAEPDK